MIVPLIIGGAIALFSCSGNRSAESAEKVSERNMMTERSENIEVVMSENGRPSYRFSTPLIEGYSNAYEPYREFREGVKIVTYHDDSLSNIDTILEAKYAIYYEKGELWEATGDVVVIKSDGRELRTQQLFWDSKAKLIYSNVQTEIRDNNSNDIFRGEGFESDETMDKWSFRRLKGSLTFDMSQNGGADTSSSELPEYDPIESTPIVSSDQNADPRKLGADAANNSAAPPSIPQRGERSAASQPSTRRDMVDPSSASSSGVPRRERARVRTDVRDLRMEEANE